MSIGKVLNRIKENIQLSDIIITRNGGWIGHIRKVEKEGRKRLKLIYDVKIKDEGIKDLGKLPGAGANGTCQPKDLHVMM